MTVAKDQLLEIMRSRFDYHSARAVLERALDASQLEDKDSYPEAEVARLAETLGSIESRMDQVIERIAALAGGAAPSKPPPPLAAPKKPEPAPKPAPAKPAVETKPAVTITLSGVDVADGGEVLVCGGCAALGDWEPGAAAAMTRAGHAWKLSLDLDGGSNIELKFLRRDADGTITWEAGDNRVLEVGDKGGSLDAEWRPE